MIDETPPPNRQRNYLLHAFAIFAAMSLVFAIETAAGDHPDCQYTEGKC